MQNLSYFANVFQTFENFDFMRIGFDAKRFFYNHSGLGNYSRNIVSYLSEFYPKNDFVLFSSKMKNRIEYSLSKTYQIVEPKCTNLIKNNSLWRTKGILKESEFEKLDIYHGLSNELPIGISKTKVKSVLTVHDLIFVRFPELYKPIDRRTYLWKMKKSCKVADIIIAISHQTKRDLIEILNVNENKIRVVYQGCNEIYFNKKSKQQKKELKAKYKLPQNFILNVGTIEPRKKAKLIVEALHFGRIDFPLVIVGKERPYANEIRKFIVKNKMENQVKIITNVDFDDLPTLYQSAEMFVYPSIFEGFGIPIIEAFVSEVPVIVSDIDLFSEVASDAALFFEKNNHESMAEKIELLLNNPKISVQKKIAGLKRAEFFSGRNVANDLMKVYSEII